MKYVLFFLCGLIAITASHSSDDHGKPGESQTGTNQYVHKIAYFGFGGSGSGHESGRHHSSEIGGGSHQGSGIGESSHQGSGIGGGSHQGSEIGESSHHGSVHQHGSGTGSGRGY